jgi:hypothetical protein
MPTGFWWGNVKKKGLFERHRCRWGYNFKVDLQEMRREEMNWNDMLMASGEFECGNESLSSIKCGDFLDWIFKDSAPWRLSLS